MPDFWGRDTALFLWMALCAVLVFALQLVLCSKAKRLLVKLLPPLLPALAAAVFYTMMITATDWSAMVYLICAVFCGAMLLAAALAWGVWKLLSLSQKKPQTR